MWLTLGKYDVLFHKGESQKHLPFLVHISVDWHFSVWIFLFSILPILAFTGILVSWLSQIISSLCISSKNFVSIFFFGVLILNYESREKKKKCKIHIDLI